MPETELSKEETEHNQTEHKNKGGKKSSGSDAIKETVLVS